MAENQSVITCTVGRHTYFGPDCAVTGWQHGELIRIGNFCSIADRVRVFVGGGHRTELPSTFPFDKRLLPDPADAVSFTYRTSRPTVIGNDVWIGGDAVISSGVQVGDGAVIARSSVVFGDVPAYAIVAGNPARVLRYRFSGEIVESLLRIRWWDWPTEEVVANLEWFKRPVAEFVAEFDPHWKKEVRHG